MVVGQNGGGNQTQTAAGAAAVGAKTAAAVVGAGMECRSAFDDSDNDNQGI